MTGKKYKLLFIEANIEWQNFVKDALKKYETIFDVSVVSEFTKLEKCSDINGFDLVFLGLRSALDNVSEITEINQLQKCWHFVVLYPGIQPGTDVFRLLFKAGVFDLSSRPMKPDALYELIKDVIAQIEKNKKLHEKANIGREEALKQFIEMIQSDEVQNDE